MQNRVLWPSWKSSLRKTKGVVTSHSSNGFLNRFREPISLFSWFSNTHKWNRRLSRHAHGFANYNPAAKGVASFSIRAPLYSFCLGFATWRGKLCETLFTQGFASRKKYYYYDYFYVYFFYSLFLSVLLMQNNGL